MSRVVFRKQAGFSNWVLIFAGLGVALLIPGFIKGEAFLAFFGCLGGVWILVAVLVAVVVMLAGKGQITEVSLDGETLTLRSVGLFGPGRSFVMPQFEATNWRWLTQGAHPRLGDRLLMLAFDYRGKTYRLPISTAEVVDLDALRTIVPSQVFDDMIEKNPGRVAHRPLK